MSASGERVAAVDYSSTAMVWDVATGRALCTIAQVVDDAGLAFDGLDRLVVAGVDGCVAVWRIDGALLSKRLWDPWMSLAHINHLAVDPTASRVMADYRDGRSRMWDLGSATLLNETRGEDYRAVALTAEPDRVLAIIDDELVDRTKSQEQRSVRQLHGGH